MKTKIITFMVVMMCVVATILSVNQAQATTIHMEKTGAGDGHCTKCGLSNGRYRCPAFHPASGSQPTTCGCGHNKKCHVYKQ